MPRKHHERYFLFPPHYTKFLFQDISSFYQGRHTRHLQGWEGDRNREGAKAGPLRRLRTVGRCVSELVGVVIAPLGHKRGRR